MTKPSNQESRDTTITDIHKTREMISDAFGGNIRAISEDARKRQQQSGRATVSHAKSTEQAVDPKRA